MDRFPRGAWTLQRPNIVCWTSDLENLRSSTGLRDALQRIQQLGRRLHYILQSQIEDEDLDEDDEDYSAPAIASMPPPMVPSKSQSARKVDSEATVVVNDPKASCILISSAERLIILSSVNVVPHPEPLVFVLSRTHPAPDVLSAPARRGRVASVHPSRLLLNPKPPPKSS